MAQLVIKGHPSRGKEVIEILEMLGGKNNYNLKGDEKYAYYTIDRDGEIRGGIYIYSNDENENMVSFTLEIFEDKFPYKVGDKVKTIYDEISIVKQLVWSNKDNAVKYELEVDEGIFYFANELQPYKEENMEEKKINQISLANCDLDEVEIVLGDRFELKTKDGKYYAVRKKPKYPKTYEDCCKMLNTYHNRNSVCNGLTHKATNYDLKLFSLLETFRQLIVCRDTYWKIAGEELGLGKPWEPNVGEDKYVILRAANVVVKSYKVSSVLEFPTPEIRDAFFDNFKDLIEQCKDLL